MSILKTSVLATLFIGVAASAQITNPQYQAWVKANGFKPGMYEYKMNIEMSGIPGMGTMKMPPTTFKQCVTQKDVDEGRQMTSDPKNGGFKCNMLSFNVQGSGGQYEQACEGSGMKMTVLGQFEQKGDSQIHKNKTAMQGSGMNTNSNTVMEIRRLGDC